MSADNVMKFLEKVSSDAAFRTQLERASESAANPQAEVRKIAEEAGFAFTPKEYREATQALRESALSDKELGNVVGGLMRSTSLLSQGSTLYTLFATSGTYKTLA